MAPVHVWRSVGFVLAAAAFAGIAALTVWALSAQSRQISRDSYARCIDRTANTNRANAFAARMAADAMKRLAQERNNRFIDQSLRNARVAVAGDEVTAWSSLIYAAPHCGPKP